MGTAVAAVAHSLPSGFAVPSGFASAMCASSVVSVVNDHEHRHQHTALECVHSTLHTNEAVMRRHLLIGRTGGTGSNCVCSGKGHEKRNTFLQSVQNRRP